MILELILSICICIIFFLILSNFYQIKKLEKRHDDNLINMTKIINSINSKISAVVNKNNEINMKNVTTLLNKLDSIEELSKSTGNTLNIEIENLRSNLNFLKDNSDFYGYLNDISKQNSSRTGTSGTGTSGTRTSGTGTSGTGTSGTRTSGTGTSGTGSA